MLREEHGSETSAPTDDQPTDRPTDQPTRTDRLGHRKVLRPITFNIHVIDFVVLFYSLIVTLMIKK